MACHVHHDSERVAACLRKYGLQPENHVVEASLEDESQVRRLRDDVESRFGAVWGLLNVAGRSTNSMSWKLTTAEFRRVLDDNLMSTFHCCREFIPGMREQKGGRIINFSSVVASSGTIGAAHYCAAKAAVMGWTRALALELASKQITVNALALGYYEYGLIHQLSAELQQEVRSRIPLKRFGTAAEIGGCLKFLLSPEGQYTTGQVIHINGGLY